MFSVSAKGSQDMVRITAFNGGRSKGKERKKKIKKKKTHKYNLAMKHFPCHVKSAENQIRDNPIFTK